VEFDNAFLFKYSPRKDTPAAAMPDQLPEELIEARHARLLEAVNEIGKRKYDRLIGRAMQILVEGPSKKNPVRFTAARAATSWCCSTAPSGIAAR